MMDRRLVSLCSRATEASEEERRLVADFLRAMRKFKAGEVVKYYIPQRDAVERAEQRRRILRALKSGEPIANIARREGLTVDYIRRMPRRFGTLPP